MAKQRYSIWGREYCSDHDAEIVQVQTNPQAMVDALINKTLLVSKDGVLKKTTVRKYAWLRIVDNEKAP